MIFLFPFTTHGVLRMTNGLWLVSHLVAERDRLASQEVEGFCQHASHLLLGLD